MHHSTILSHYASILCGYGTNKKMKLSSRVYLLFYCSLRANFATLWKKAAGGVRIYPVEVDVEVKSGNLHMRMFACVPVCLCAYDVHVCTCVHVCRYVHLCVHACVRACVCVCVCVCMPVFVWVPPRFKKL